MVVSSLTSSKYCNIGEKSLKLNTLTTQQQTLLKQNEFIDVFTMVHQTSNNYIQAVMNNLKFII